MDDIVHVYISINYKKYIYRLQSVGFIVTVTFLYT